MDTDIYIHPTVEIGKDVSIGKRTYIWAYSILRENSKIGNDCVIGRNVYIDKGVILGDHVFVNNNCFIGRPTIIEDNVFIGPGVIITNDKNPRSKIIRNLENISLRIKKGASIGASTIILPDLTIGSYSLIGAGCVVTKDVPDHGLVYGNPATLKGYVCYCGNNLNFDINKKIEQSIIIKCNHCNKSIILNSKKSILNIYELPVSFISSKNWLLNSGIQNINISPLIDGSFNSWYDIEHNNYEYAYSEITGYGITTLLYIYNLTKDKIYLERAELSANWLLLNALHKTDGLKARFYFNHAKTKELFDNSQIFSFDVGIVLYGIISLYQITNNNLYLNFSIKLANFLLSMQKEDGSFYAIYSTKENKFKDICEKWSSQSGSFHSKIAMGLYELYLITKKEEYKDAVLKICEFALQMQHSSGRFISDRDKKYTHLHPHSYSCEGLLYIGLMMKKNDYIEAVTKAVKWSLDIQLPNGGIPFMFEPVESAMDLNKENKIIEIERTDVLAQTLRLGVLLFQLGKLESQYLQKLDNLYKRLISFLNTDENTNKQQGGIYFGTDFDGIKKQHLNSWCTMFALQAFLYYDFFKNNKTIDINYLV